MSVERGLAMIDSILFFQNGTYAAFSGDQEIPGEQGWAWIGIVQEKLDRGIVGPETVVRVPLEYGQEKWTVGELLEAGLLKRKS